MGDHVVQQLVVNRHVPALVGFAVKLVAQLGDGGGFANRHGFKQPQDLLGVAATETDGAVAMDVREVVGMNWAGQPLAAVYGGIALTQEKYHARLGNGRRFANGVRAQWHGFQRIPVLLQIPQQLGYEIVQGEVAHRRTVVQVVHHQDLLPEFEQLLIPELQLQLGIGFGEWVFVPTGRNVRQRHPRLHPIFQLQVYVHVGRGPVVQHPYRSAAAADAVDAPTPLDETHWIPVDVVVEHGVAVLQVLPFGDAVGGNQQINVHTLV